MSPNLDSHVQTQMPVAIINRTLSNGNGGGEGKAVGRRRVFVQTDKGCVLGMELDRVDNAHTVKRRLQLALNVPAGESFLTYGDLVLKNDLSAIRNDSPLLLSRINRSCSTPCLSPNGRDLEQRDRSGPIEVLGCSNRCSRLEKIVKDVSKAIRKGVEPVSVQSGLGGVYFFRNSRGEHLAIVKPTDEEPFAPNNPKGYTGKALGLPGLKRSVRVGETGYREVAAYLLDYDHFANVPPTGLVKISHSVFCVNDKVTPIGVNDGIAPKRDKGFDKKKQNIVSKIASLQQFVPHDFDASDYGTSSFPVAAVHRIGILDIRIFNTDRHAGNLLVRKVEGGVSRFGGHIELIPIDHGLCLPESLEDPYFEWIHWPQASIPFSEDELEYIANLDPARDCEMLRMEIPMIREACLRVLTLCTSFLKEATKFGLCLAEIGDMMSRGYSGRNEEPDNPSELEVICMEARRLVAEREIFLPEIDSGVVEDTVFDIDSEDFDKFDSVFPRPPSPYFVSKGWSPNPLSKLNECLEEELEEYYEKEKEAVIGSSFLKYVPLQQQHSNVSQLSASMNDISLNKKLSCYQAGVPSANISTIKNNNSSGGALQGGRSANEQIPASACYVKLGDMNEEEWEAFLQKFQWILHDALSRRNCGGSGHRMRQRLGTSCRF